LVSNIAPQLNEDHMTGFGLRAPSLSGRIFISDALPASLHSLRSNAAPSNLLNVFCSDLKYDPRSDDNNNDAPKCALFRLMTEDQDAHCPRVSPEFQP
jgi:hypothetical protein